jgi:predicted Zn-dependent protease with MMP-like domain
VAEEEVAGVIRRLPVDLREQAEGLPVTYEGRPSPGMRKDGIEPDTMGLFVGAEFGDEVTAGADVPPQIILFLDVIREEAEEDEAVFRREVRTTYLHELGHYLGLDEEGLEDRDLG